MVNGPGGQKQITGLEAGKPTSEGVAVNQGKDGGTRDGVIRLRAMHGFALEEKLMRKRIKIAPGSLPMMCSIIEKRTPGREKTGQEMESSMLDMLSLECLLMD